MPGEGDSEDCAYPDDGFSLEDLTAQVEQNHRGEHRLTVPELFYVATDEVVRRVLDSQGVETIGQLAPDPAGHARRLELYRTANTDPSPEPTRFAIKLEFPSAPPTFDPAAWYCVSGKMHYRNEGGETLGILAAEALGETLAPLEDG